jgi:parvulin-like peptidyl-prolyl isomerase
MSKRDTTGGPKPKARTQADHARQQTYLSRAERDHMYQRWVLVGAALVGIVVLVILVGALVNDQFVVPGQELVKVNGEELTIDEFRDRLKYERFTQAEQVRAVYNSVQESDAELSDQEVRDQTISLLSQQGSPLEQLLNTEGFANQVLTAMEQELIVGQTAEELGVEVDDAAIEEAVENEMTLYTGRILRETPTSTPSEVPSETATPLVTSTASPTPSQTLTPSQTVQPTLEGCAEGEECATVTPLPTSVPSNTPTVTPEFSETPTPTETPLTIQDSAATTEAFRNDYFSGGEETSGLNEDAIRNVFYYRALSDGVRDIITADSEAYPDYFVGEDETWVDVRHILIQFPQDQPAPPEGDDNEYYEEAFQIYEALQAGESFAALAQSASDDGSGANGGSLGWSTSSDYVEGFKEAVETLPIGAISEPVRSQFGYHVIQVMDREARDLTDTQEESLRDQKFAEWLQEQRLIARIERRDSWQDYIPDEPDINDLLEDLLGKYDATEGGFDTEG